MTTTPHVRFFRDRLGQSVAYAKNGTGPLVICPAWWISHVQKDWDYEPFRTFFEQLGQGLTIVRYDRPSVGLSDRNVKPRTLEYEVDLLDDVATELGEETYALFAVSCAGPIAIRHTIRHPKNVERIVFCGSFLNGPDICSRDVQDAVRSVVRAHWGMGSRALADIFLPDADAEQLDAFAKQTRAACSADAADDLLGLTYTMSATEVVSKVSADCLVIHRAGDRAIPFENGRALVAKLPNAHLVTLDGRTHPPWFGGDKIARLANTFLLGETTTSTAKPKIAETQPGEQSPIRFDIAGKCLVIEDGEVTLTPIEFGIMKMLTAHSPNVVSRDDLLSAVWQQPYEGSNRVDVAISALRRKLGPWSRSIETVTGHGYRFRNWQKPE